MNKYSLFGINDRINIDIDFSKKNTKPISLESVVLDFYGSRLPIDVNLLIEEFADIIPLNYRSIIGWKFKMSIKNTEKYGKMIDTFQSNLWKYNSVININEFNCLDNLKLGLYKNLHNTYRLEKYIKEFSILNNIKNNKHHKKFYSNNPERMDCYINNRVKWASVHSELTKSYLINCKVTSNGFVYDFSHVNVNLINSSIMNYI